MVSINQRLDVENITLVADEFGFEVEFQKEYTAEILEDIEDDEEDLQTDHRLLQLWVTLIMVKHLCLII